MATFAEALPGLQAQGYTNIMDALAAYNAGNAASLFGTPAPAPAPAPVSEPAPALFMPTSAPAPATTPTPTLSAPASMPVFGPVAPTATPAPSPTPAPAPAATGMMMPTVSLAQTDAIVREVSTRFPEDGARIQEIARIYQETLGRSPDIDGLISYTASGKSLETIKRDMAYSPEGQTLIKTLFNNTLGRDPDAGAIKTYTEFLAKEKPYIQSYGNSEIEALKTELKISPEGQARNADPAAAELARIYKEYAGRDLDASGYAYFKDALTSPNGAAKIAEAIKTGDEAELRTKLGRQPTEAETQAYMQQRDAQRAAEGRQFGNFVKSVLPIAIGFAFPGAALAIGESLGLSGAAASSIGKSIISGVVSGVATGDVEKALVTSALVGGGDYLVNSGIVGNTLNNIGLGDAAQKLNIPIGNVMSEADFIAADAAQLAKQGLSTAAIQQNLVAAGVDPVIAASAANLAITGASTAAISADIGKFASPTTPLLTLPAGAPSGTVGPTSGMLTGPGAAAAGTTAAGATGAGATGAGATGAAGTAAAGAAGAAAATTPGLLTTTANVAGNLLSSNTLQSLLKSGIDFATASKIASDLESQAGKIQGQAVAAGKAAQVPFTPYTVTTGMGTTKIGATEATMTATPEYKKLQEEALRQAQSALSAIAPEQAAKTLYNQAEALAAPGRAREQEALLAGLQARGLTGFGQNLPTVGGGVRTVNPLFESLLSAQETARAQQALQATQFGTQEAQRQQQLAAGLQTQAQNVDIQQLNQLLRAQGLSQDQINLALKNAEAQRLSTLSGLQYSTPLLTSAANIRSGQTAQLGTQAQNLFSNLFAPATTLAPTGQGTGAQYGYQDYGIFF